MKIARKRFAQALRELVKSGDPRQILIEHLGFDHVEHDAVDRSKWLEEWEDQIRECRFIAEKSGFRVALVVAKEDTPHRTWLAVARRILIDYNGLALVCVHGGDSLRWLWSSSSLAQRRTTAALAEGIRHITVELKPDGTAPTGFLDLLSQLDVSETRADLDVLAMISSAFDHYTMILQTDIGKNAFEALRVLSEGLLSRASNKLKRNVDTLERIRPEVFILLYRFLFVLFAEARDIFPVGHQVYLGKYSLQWWRENVTLPFEKDGADALKVLGGPKGATLWQRCRGLFHLIKAGSVSLGHKREEFDFRPYYGTIFDDELHPELESWEIPNEHLAEAMRALTRFRDEGGSTFFVDYSSLEIRHIGSIYERLLEYHLAIAENGAVEHTINELERKSTGSYFTPSVLIDRLVASTLDPLLDRIRKETGEASPEAFEKSVYDLNVCDPAMGSGHFLVGVLNHLAKAILDYRQSAGASSGSPEESTEVKRTIVRQCLHGVDKNPLAVELAKMSLWLETANSSRPLSFLDAHLKSGDSLVGATFESLLDPQRSILGEDIQDHLRDEVRDLVAIERQEEIDAVDVMHKVHKYRRIRSKDTRYGRLARLLDAQVSSFFGAPAEDWRNARGLLGRPGEFDTFVNRPAWREVEAVAKRVSFFHWELEFPEVFFSEDGVPRSDPGFDAVMGNPPWDKIKVLDREFFRYRAPEIANAQTAAKRERLLAEMEKGGSLLWREYIMARRDSANLADYMRGSGGYKLSAHGDINYYPLFLEKALVLARSSGLIGMVIPTGLVTDYSNQELVQHLFESRRLRSVADFENKGLFPDLDSRYRFSLVSIAGLRTAEMTQLAFLLHDPSEMDDQARWLELSAEDVRLFNPNTRTVPVFRSRRDAEINRKMYHVAGGVFVDENKGENGNPWRARPCGMFHMTNDSRHFKTRAELERKGWKLKGNHYVKDERVMVPLFEAKMINMWNPRFATYCDATEEDIHMGHCRDATLEELRNMNWEPLPRYWVDERVARQYWDGVGWKRPWVIVFRDIARAMDERTMISTFAPAVAFGNQSPGLLVGRSWKESSLLVANMSSLPLDYCARNKTQGTHMNFFVLYQLPILPPAFYERWRIDGGPLADYISTVILSLACTSTALRPLAEEAGFRTIAAKWIPETRFKNMRILDGIYAHLYEISRDEFAHILDTFLITRENETQQYGEFRTKTSALRNYDDLASRMSKK
jgi:hypothetical protein